MADCCAVCRLPLGPNDCLTFQQSTGLMFCRDHRDSAHPREPDEFAWGSTAEDEALIEQTKRFDNASIRRMQRMVDDLNTLERLLALPVPEPIGHLEEFNAA